MSAKTAPPTPLLSPQQLAEYLGVSVKTIYAFNSEGTGPKFAQCGRRVRYKLTDVDAWLAAGGTAGTRYDPSRR